MTDANDWPRSCPDHLPPPGEVHLWRIPLFPRAERVEARAALLSREETERAARFRFETHRQRYVLRRGALKRLLGGYLGIEPDRVGFRYSDRGKPELVDSSGQARLEFNLSDSEDWALLGVVLERSIGVDIEQMRPIEEIEALVRDHFSAREHQVFLGLDPGQKLAGFYNGWTRKEAWLKARGEGITAPLDAFDVTLAPDEPPRLLEVRGSPGEAERWSLSACRPADGYVGALAVLGPPIRILQMTYEEAAGEPGTAR